MTDIPEEIRERLEAAEQVCILFSWGPSYTDNPESKALFELWRHWLKVSGVSTDPADHPELSRERINDLAAQYDGKQSWELKGGADD